MNSQFSNLVLFLISLAIACTSPDPEKRIEMEFNVDSTLVNREISDSLLSIRYHVPADWKELQPSDSALQQLESKNIRISKILQNPAANTVFSLTDVRAVPDSVFRNLDLNFKTVLNPSGAWSNIERAEFMTSGFNVKQYVLTRTGQTFFKMLFEERKQPFLQIDYSIVLDSAYTLNTKTLESIVGSLQRDH